MLLHSRQSGSRLRYGRTCLEHPGKETMQVTPFHGSLPGYRLRQTAASFLIMIACLLCSTLAGMLFFHQGLSEDTIILLYVMGVVICTKLTHGAGYGITASFAAVLLFNYFFTIPYNSLAVDDSNYPITFFIMGVTSLIASTITSSEKKSASTARFQAEQANAFYELTRSLRGTVTMEEAEQKIVTCFRQTFGVEVRFAPGDKPAESSVFLNGPGNGTSSRKNRFRNWVIAGKEKTYGVLSIPEQQADQLDESQLRLMDSMCQCAALGLEKTDSISRQLEIQEQVVQEHYRSDLLRSISHDLRTPLAGILGTCDMLLETEPEPARRRELIRGILQETAWLYSLVENILSLTRMEEGRLSLHCRPECAEELVEAAIRTVEIRHPDCHIGFEVPADLIMVQADGKLIVQLLVNLLENAIRHTLPDSGMDVQLKVDDKENMAVFTVRDEGCGLDPGDLPHLFEPFYTGEKNRLDRGRGTGLGLAICQSIAQAHGGWIRAQNRLDRSGAQFEVGIPLYDDGSPKQGSSLDEPGQTVMESASQ